MIREIARALREADRIDNDGDYEPSNCRWAMSTEQANNKGVMFRDGVPGLNRPHRH